MKATVIAFVLSLLTSIVQAQWIPQASGTTARLRGLCVVDERIAWASGTGGTILRTTDGGTTWLRVSPVDAEALDFRDIEAFDDRIALGLSIGEGKLSRIYRTEDGGATWSIRHRNLDATRFLDALAFWNPRNGLALGDPVDGRFVILTTDDGGRTWSRSDLAGLPEALPGEGAFAASGTCLIARGDCTAWFGTGAGRVFRSQDRGRTWTAQPTPIRAGNGTSGIFSLAFRDPGHGIAVGGDYKQPGGRGDNVALTGDGGRNWTQPKGPGPRGYRSAVAYLEGSPLPVLITVGPTGTDRSADGGASWERLGDEGFDAVQFAGTRAGWAVGENGRIARFDPKALLVDP